MNSPTINLLQYSIMASAAAASRSPSFDSGTEKLPFSALMAKSSLPDFSSFILSDVMTAFSGSISRMRDL